jgi:hypothetical protein
MTTSTQLHPSSRNTPGRILAVFGGVVLALAVTAFVTAAAIVRSIRAPTDLVDLRAELVKNVEVEVLSSVEVAAPSWLTALGRLGAGVVDAEPEVKAALRTVRAGQVGVYELAAAPGRPRMRELLEWADDQVAPRNWTRVVTVLDNDQLVAIYASAPEARSGELIDCLVLVLDQRSLVLVSAMADAEPLIALVASRFDTLQLAASR